MSQIIKRLFLLQLIFAAFVIQFTGQQDVTCIAPNNRLHVDLLYGFPLPFITTNGIDDGYPKILPSPGGYLRHEYPDGPPHYFGDSPHPSSLTARIFNPPQPVGDLDYTTKIKRRGVFIWEHLHHGEWERYAALMPDDSGNIHSGGVRLNFLNYPLPQQLYINFSLNPGLLLTQIDYDLNTNEPRMREYCPIPCFLYDMIYVFLVIPCCYFLAKTTQFYNSRYTWPFLIIATQVFIIVGLVYYILNIHHIRMDIGWFYQILYLTNCVTVFVMIYCYSKWFLQGIYSLMKMFFRKHT